MKYETLSHFFKQLNIFNKRDLTRDCIYIYIYIYISDTRKQIARMRLILFLIFLSTSQSEERKISYYNTINNQCKYFTNRNTHETNKFSIPLILCSLPTANYRANFDVIVYRCYTTGAKCLRLTNLVCLK